MKKASLVILAFVLLFACKQKNSSSDTGTQAEVAHTGSLRFVVSSSSNITHFNVYANDMLLEQINSTMMDSVGSYGLTFDEFTDLPDKLSYVIEPMYMDSTNADARMSLALTVDEQTETKEDVLLAYGEVVDVEMSFP